MANNDTKYIIYSGLGKKYEVNENTTNNETPIIMVGKGLPDYGEEQNTNFLRVAENFASTTEPTNPIDGMIWFKRIEGDAYELMVCKNSEIDDKWDKIPQLHTNNGGTPPEFASTGDMWYNSIEHKFYIFDGTVISEDNPNGTWVEIGPSSFLLQKNFIDTRLLNRSNSNTLVYTINGDKFGKDTNTSTIESVNSTGTLNSVTMKVLAKEFINGGFSDNCRCCAWLYKFLVQVKKKNDFEYTMSIVGSPDYELIGKTDNTNWTIDIAKDGSNINVLFKDKDGTYTNNSYISLCYNVDITRI